MHQLPLQGSEKRLGYSVVIAAASAAHTLNTAGSFHQGLEPFAAILRPSIRVKDQAGCGPSSEHCVFEGSAHQLIRLFMLQPTIRRENTSRTTARYSQPSAVQMYVMSPGQS